MLYKLARKVVCAVLFVAIALVAVNVLVVPSPLDVTMCGIALIAGLAV